ncbi:MAG: hypothetical protein IJ062_07720 [Firmicutes bacterium]|nr:hypothetical protein [Bacillota bacterium]
MKKRITAVLLAAILLAGCGSGKENKEQIEALESRITAVDTELASMFGKIEDMHARGVIDDDFYKKFTDLDNKADECMEYAGNSPKTDELEKKVSELEALFAEFKEQLAVNYDENDAALMSELINLQLAAKEQAGLMQRALESGRITQEEYDEFVALRAQVDDYNNQADLEYNDEFRENFEEIRSRLTALASKAGADNALIDRLVGSEDADREGTEPDEEKSDIKEAESGEIETEQPKETPKQPMPDNVAKVIDDYMELQEFVTQKQSSGEINDAQYIDVLGVGVELAYLKEAIEKDGVTENNTYTLQEIKGELYEKAQAVGYEKAEVFQ